MKNWDSSTAEVRWNTNGWFAISWTSLKIIIIIFIIIIINNDKLVRSLLSPKD